MPSIAVEYWAPANFSLSDLRPVRTVIAQAGRNHRLRGRPQDQRFLEVLAATFGDELKFRGEARDVVLLLLEKTERNQCREVPVLVPGLLDETVERIANVFP